MANFGSKEHRQGMAGIKRTGSSGRSGARAAHKRARAAGIKATKAGAKTYERLAALQASGKKLTKTQLKALERREVDYLRTHGLAGTDAQIKKEQKQLMGEHEKAQRARARVIARILGPSGVAHAVKISRADGEPFRAYDLAAWRSSGWTIEAAGTVAGRPGAGGLPGTVVRPEDWPPYQNPDPLGAGGLARAFILTGGPINEDLLLDLVADGLDVTPAPKKWREGVAKNPHGNTKERSGKTLDGETWEILGGRTSGYSLWIGGALKKTNLKTIREAKWWVRRWNQTYPAKNPGGCPNPSDPKAKKKVYEVMKAAAKKGQALREDEISEKARIDAATVGQALADLIRNGQAHIAGADLFGPCYFPGVPAVGLFANPSAEAKAEKKAAAWFQREPSEARRIKLPATVEAVEVGRIVAIEYESDKYDGKRRVWRHESTKPRELHISTDGKVMVILPGFKITKRGIEG